jgi:hypothetical protein
MSRPTCSADTAEICAVDGRRALVRSSGSLAGIDYVEVYPDGVTLCVHFFGTPPQHLTAGHVTIEGGVRIRDVVVTRASFHEHDDGDLCLLITINKTGDFSAYCVCLIEPPGESHGAYGAPAPASSRTLPDGIDPRYACASFFFRLDCASTLDCKPEPCPPPAKAPLPPIDYLARDYDSFRRLLLDRLAQTMPEWRERHAPDLGITLVEIFAYVADQLSYQLDAVSTEAFLRTARRRISVRRHARLVDYWMHEGCNARAWVTIASNTDLPGLPIGDLAFGAMAGDDARGGGVMEWRELQAVPGALIFEPVAVDGRDHIDIVAAQTEIQFYTWNRTECCLPAGSTRATLYDGPPLKETTAPSGQDVKASTYSSKPTDTTTPDPPPHRLRLKAGDVLIFEESRGCATGSAADADPSRRHVVRLTKAAPAEDPLTLVRIWEIEWHRDDALPFDLRLSVRTAAPDCQIRPAAVARGNVVLVDHGMTVDERNDAWVVEVEAEALCCLCDGASVEQHTTAKRLAIELAQRPLTYAEPIAGWAGSARAMMQRDVRAALPRVSLDAAAPDRYAAAPAAAQQADDSTHMTKPVWAGTFGWRAVRDLLASGPDDEHFAVEIDDQGVPHLRFGDGLNGRQPAAGWRFRARYRAGNGAAGNVGRDAIVWFSRKSTAMYGATLKPRNPLPASGGLAPESIDHVKRYAPYAFSRVLERAVAAADYAQLATNDPRVQGAFAELAWTGSWHEAAVALDPIARYPGAELTPAVLERLEGARRIGHDLRLVPVRRVALEIGLSICVEPGHLRGDVERVARAVLSSRTLPDGSRGLFHPDEWRFGADVAGSRLIAAVQAIDGVAHVELTRFERMDASEAVAARSLGDNVIVIGADEIAVFEADANFPEHGRLTLQLAGGR